MTCPPGVRSQRITPHHFANGPKSRPRLARMAFYSEILHFVTPVSNFTHIFYMTNNFYLQLGFLFISLFHFVHVSCIQTAVVN